MKYAVVLNIPHSKRFNSLREARTYAACCSKIHDPKIFIDYEEHRSLLLEASHNLSQLKPEFRRMWGLENLYEDVKEALDEQNP